MMGISLYNAQLTFVLIWLAFVIVLLVKEKDHNNYNGDLTDYEYYVEWRNTIFQLIVAVAVLRYVR